MKRFHFDQKEGGDGLSLFLIPLFFSFFLISFFFCEFMTIILVYLSLQFVVFRLVYPFPPQFP